jgi:AAA15 family ATPase/GTPase
MILNITLKNYRSFKDDTSFTMIAESSKSKEQNVFIQSLAKGEDEIRLLNTALIYGANASGKTNLLRALYEIIGYIAKSKPKAGENIPIYDPFKFSSETKESPVEFSLEFVGKDSIKYKYELNFDKRNVIKEELTYWPNNKQTLLLKRIVSEDLNSLKHTGQLGSIFKSKEIEIFHNQALLSKFGEDIPNEIISEVYIYISKIEVINACSSRRLSTLKKEILEKMVKNSSLLQKMNELIRFADTGLKSINISEINEDDLVLPKDIPDATRNKLLNDFKYFMTGNHPYYQNLQLSKDDEELPFDQESHGTKTLFALGGRLLQAIEYGEVIFVDELETSLHPYLSKLLVSLFQNPRINKRNSQLIFTTHDITLLDRTLFRKDQVWFAEKNEYGATNLYSLQDFNDVREDTPFDKWYLAGKFGGIPNIKSLESLFVEE